MMPDVFHHLLSGSTVSEYTAVSTTGGLRHGRGTDGPPTCSTRLGIPTDILPEVALPGTDVGAADRAYRSTGRWPAPG